MEVKTKGKYIRISPIKARSIANLVRGKNAVSSLVTLKFMPHKAARVILKVVKTAIADAEHNYLLDGKALTIEKITVDKGPSYKRWRPASKGMTKPFERPSSHITVVVSGEAKLAKIKKDNVEHKDVAEKTETSKIKDEVFTHDDKKSKNLNIEKKGNKGFFRRKTG